MEENLKQLLLKDLCARLSYGVKFTLSGDNIYTMKGIDLIATDEGDWEYAVTAKGISPIEIKYIKPYLRPMSSMTEEEYTKYRTMQGRNCDYGESTICVSKSLYPRHLYDDGEPVKITVYYPNPVIQDWLNKKMFDYRGLIEKGLALEAPEGMYV